jgi:hypothetical protein
MKKLSTIAILLASSFFAGAQTRNVIVDTNSIVVSPTNFWTASTTNIRSAIGFNWLGLTNSNAATFQAALFGGASINAQGQKITNLATPTISNEAATKAYVDSLVLRVPPSITSFTATSGGLSVFEIGTTISNVTLTWTITPTNLVLSNQTLSPNIGSVDASLRTTNLTGISLTTDTAWTNVINDGLGFNNSIVTNSSASIAFRHYLSWGRSSLANLGNSEIQTLHTTGGGADRAFATARQRTFTISVSNQYVYFAYPLSFSSATQIRVGGLPNSSFTNTTVTYTNASGNISSFLIYRTLETISGDNITYEIQ